MNDDQLSFVMGSKRRQETLLCIAQEKGMAIDIAQRLNIHVTLLYNTLRALSKNKLIAHNNVKRYKVYHITQDGLDVLKHMGVIE